MRKNRIIKTIIATILATVLALPTPVLAADSYVESLTLDRTSITIEQEDEDYVLAKVKVQGGASAEIKAESSNKKIVDVIELEVLDPGDYEPGWTLITLETYEVLGEATVTVTTKGSNKNKKQLSQTIKVTVVEEIPEELPGAPKKDAREDGIYLESDGSTTTLETDGTKQTKLNYKTDINGTSVETISVIDLETGDYELTEIKRDASLNVIQTSKSSRTIEADGTEVVTGSIVLQNGSGIEKKIVSKDGNVSTNTVTNGVGGIPQSIQQENNSADGGSESMLFLINGDNTIELQNMESNADKIVIPLGIDAANGQVYYVNKVCANAVSGNTEVKGFVMNYDKKHGVYLEPGALGGCESLTYITFVGNNDMYITVDKENASRAKKSGGKIVLGKNCLKGTHKNLLIEVPDKKTMKSIKKQLNKAKAPKGTKVKVAK